MTSFLETLPPCKSSKHRAVRWTPHPACAGCPCSGHMEIGTTRGLTRYNVIEFPTTWDGRAFRVEKADGSEVYDVFVPRDHGFERCDCMGFERYDHCKHTAALRAVLANGWLPHSGENGEQDVGPTEAE